MVHWPPTGVCKAGLWPGPCRQQPPHHYHSPHLGPHNDRHLHFFPGRHQRPSNNRGQELPPRRACESARVRGVRARRAENSSQTQRTGISAVESTRRSLRLPGAQRRNEAPLGRQRAQRSLWSERAETRHTHTHRSLSSQGAQRSVPGQDRQRSRPKEDTPSGRLRRPGETGCLAPSPIPSPARSASPLSGTTLTARLVAALTLGSPASGIRVPIPDPPRACARVGREAGAAAPPSPGPRQRTGKPGRKGKGRGRTAVRDAPPPGDPLQPG